MEALNPHESLRFFEKNIPEFISEDNNLKLIIDHLTSALQAPISESFHADVLHHGKDLIKYVLTSSIEYLSIESNSAKQRSIENLNKYIDAFTLFEEMLFGLDQSYRDHTLHSLWVYLFGHQFIMGMGGYDKIQIAGQMNVTFSKDGKPKFVIGTTPIKGTEQHMEAMWAMIAILHDMGYPIEVISNKPNEVFGRILEPFAVDFSAIFQMDLGSRISLLHQSICDLLSAMYRPMGLAPEEIEKYFEEAENENSDRILLVPREPTVSQAEALEMEFRIASVEKNHSAWSAILAFKNINYLHESDYHGGGGRDFLKLLTRRDILYSIVHHTSEEPKDSAINRFQFILLLIDDIEEAARYGRGGRERGIASDYCDLKWNIDGSKMTIELDYSKYEYEAEYKYNEFLKKYRIQISQKKSKSNYEVAVKFIDDSFEKELSIYLVMDNLQQV